MKYVKILEKNVLQDLSLLSRANIVKGMCYKGIHCRPRYNERNLHTRFKNYLNTYHCSWYVGMRTCISCGIHQGQFLLHIPEPLKPSSKLEETTHALKEKAKEKMIEEPESGKEIKKKKSLKENIKSALIHYYHGFKLLYLNMKICGKLVKKKITGKTLTRRESKLLSTTVGDLLRMIPFSAFIIVPFLELTLPIFVAMFPGMLPSTFETKTQKESKMKKKFKMQLEIASFLQETLHKMPAGGTGSVSNNAAKFDDFFEKVRTAGGVVTTDEIMKFARLFKDDIILDSLSRAQIVALCRILGVKTIGTTNFLRFQISLKLRSLQADDQLIMKEGINSLTIEEQQAACQVRGMPAWGVSEDRLKQQLTNWLNYSVEKKISPCLLLLSQAFMFSSDTPTEEKLIATIQNLPNHVVNATKVQVGESEGKIDYKTKVELVKDELDKIHEEFKEFSEEPAKPRPEEPAKPRHEVIDPNQIAALGSVLENKLRLEKEKLSVLKQKMTAYEEDRKEFKDMLGTTGETQVQETRAAQQLQKKLNKMLKRLDNVLHSLDEGEKALKDMTIEENEACKSGLIKIDEFAEALKKISNPQDPNHELVMDIVRRLDKDNDGYVCPELLMAVINCLTSEDVSLNRKQINEILDLLEKEEIIGNDLQIFKALNKSDVVGDLKKELEKRRAEIIQELKKEEELKLKQKDKDKKDKKYQTG